MKEIIYEINLVRDVIGPKRSITLTTRFSSIDSVFDFLRCIPHFIEDGYEFNLKFFDDGKIQDVEQPSFP